MTIPGVLYSLILAIAAWAIDYFSGAGAGASLPWAPILIAAIPIILKLISVNAPQPTAPSGAARGMGSESEAQPSRLRRLLLG